MHRVLLSGIPTIDELTDTGTAYIKSSIINFYYKVLGNLYIQKNYERSYGVLTKILLTKILQIVRYNLEHNIKAKVV
jgi:hypothetical protein